MQHLNAVFDAYPSTFKKLCYLYRLCTFQALENSHCKPEIDQMAMDQPAYYMP
uniref:Uncharacterized protein n=1 Tax=Arion vulgaris TaxID=1028688 RepID=A0A0B6ZFZ0_9EUPU